jgi:cytochrome c556
MTFKTVFAATAFCVAFSATAFAGVDDVIKERQACMKAQGGLVFGLGFPIMKGEKPYDKAAIDAAFAKSEAACANWANFWGADTQVGESVKTRAKPEIWTDAAGFEAAGNASYQATQALKAAADEAAFKAALPAVGAGCQGCHEKFQAPQN